MKASPFIAVLLVFFSWPTLWAAGRTQSALTLLEPPSARAAALGEAFTAGTDDIGVFHYNPASLTTLKSSQASFLYKQGVADDTYGHFSIGTPRTAGGLGLSVGYYNAGTAEVFDGTTQRKVTAQKDLAVGFGLAHRWGRVSLGWTGKYFSSELGEKVKADTLAADFGLAFEATPRLQVGSSLQNMWGKLKYSAKDEDLPQIARVGLLWRAFQGVYPGNLVLDVPYYAETSEIRPALGFEVGVGPMAFRTGYRTSKHIQDFSIGTGFSWGKSSLDYAFGLADHLDSRHQVSLTTRFGGVPQAPAFVAPPQKEFVYEPPAYPVFEIQRLEGGVDRGNQVYVVQEGDTLRSIAIKKYGFEAYWDDIFRANQHVLVTPEALKPGQKILLPRKNQ